MTDSNQLRTLKIFDCFFSQKYAIYLSKVEFFLFLSYLNENVLLNCIRIINRYISITSINSHFWFFIVTSTSLDEFNSINKTNLNSLEPVFTWNYEALLKNLKRVYNENQVDSYISLIRNYFQYSKPSSINVSINPNMWVIYINHLRDSFSINHAWNNLENLSKEASQSEIVLPSICGFTFHNSQNEVISAIFSFDNSILFTGSEESYIEAWSLKGTIKQLITSTDLAGLNMSEDFDLNLLFSTTNSVLKMAGHSGPIYGFSNYRDNFLLSCSQDQSGKEFNF